MKKKTARSSGADHTPFYTFSHRVNLLDAQYATPFSSLRETAHTLPPARERRGPPSVVVDVPAFVNEKRCNSSTV